MARLTRADEKDLRQKLKKRLAGYFPENSSIAVKLHMGEPGNKYFLKADFIKSIVDILKALKLKPFLFESLAAYSGCRNNVEAYTKTAEKHGFSKSKVGCPVKISDEFVAEKVEGISFEVCKEISEADGIVVVSHIKGHDCCGFGGAIKNLGMGCLTKKSKRMIHELAFPVFCGECIGCGSCAKICPGKAIAIENGKAKIDYEKCWGCDQCVVVCPQKALKPKTQLFDLLLAKGAAAAHRRMKKAFFINAIVNISEHCDCMADAGQIIAKDEGLIVGDDPVAIDKASVDLINKQAGYNLFMKIHRKDPYTQIKEAARLGMGSEKYEFD